LIAILNVVGEPGTSGNTEASKIKTFLQIYNSPFNVVEVSFFLN